MASQPIQADAAPIDTGAADATITNDTLPAATDTIQDHMYPDDQREPVTDPDAQTDPNADPDADPNVNDEDAPKPIAAPNSWPAEDKAHWDKLTPEAQAVIQRRETERDKQIYAKGQEVRQTEAQAREAVVTIANNYAGQLQALMMGTAPPQAPDHRLLQTGQEEHRALFYQQEAEVRQWQTQQQQLQSQLSAVQQQAAQIEQHNRDALLQADEAVLGEQLGDEWIEPSKRQKFLSNLEPIGGELGYTPDLMRQASATDILALRKAHEWKQGFDKWKDLERRKMADVRAHKGQNPPKMLQPGVAGSSQNNVPQTTQAILYPNDPPRR